MNFIHPLRNSIHPNIAPLPPSIQSPLNLLIPPSTWPSISKCLSLHLLVSTFLPPCLLPPRPSPSLHLSSWLMDPSSHPTIHLTFHFPLFFFPSAHPTIQIPLIFHLLILPSISPSIHPSPHPSLHPPSLHTHLRPPGEVPCHFPAEG